MGFYWPKTVRSICISCDFRSKMSRELDNNLTQMYDNWAIYNSTESVPPRNNITYIGFYLHQPSTAAIFIVSYLLIFVVCMVGNGVVCFIVLRSKNMWTVTNLFILNLAVSDLLVGIFCMPTTLLDNIITGEQNQAFTTCCKISCQTMHFERILLLFSLSCQGLSSNGKKLNCHGDLCL